MSDSANIVASIVTGIVTIATMYFTYLRLKNGLDQNTRITKRGIETTDQTKTEVKTISKKLNGGIDTAIKDGIAPVEKLLKEHAEADESNLKTINQKFEELTNYVHKRNHDVLNALQTQNNKLETLLEMVKAQNQKT